jgi:hypothetical protein
MRNSHMTNWFHQGMSQPEPSLPRGWSRRRLAAKLG